MPKYEKTRMGIAYVGIEPRVLVYGLPFEVLE
jgi:hypothetical protein